VVGVISAQNYAFNAFTAQQIDLFEMFAVQAMDQSKRDGRNRVTLWKTADGGGGKRSFPRIDHSDTAGQKTPILNLRGVVLSPSMPNLIWAAVRLSRGGYFY